MYRVCNLQGIHSQITCRWGYDIPPESVFNVFRFSYSSYVRELIGFLILSDSVSNWIRSHTRLWLCQTVKEPYSLRISLINIFTILWLTALPFSLDQNWTTGLEALTIRGSTKPHLSVWQDLTNSRQHCIKSVKCNIHITSYREK